LKLRCFTRHREARSAVAISAEADVVAMQRLPRGVYPERSFGRGVHPELDPSVASLPQDDKGEGLPKDDKGEGLPQDDTKRRARNDRLRGYRNLPLASEANMPPKQRTAKMMNVVFTLLRKGK